jgi:hypothetical protein
LCPEIGYDAVSRFDSFWRLFMAFQSFEDLQVWRRGKELAILVYKGLKDCRDFSLRDQMQRAAVSIPSNIAEGYERTPKDFA